MKWSRVFLAVLLIAVMWPQAADAQAKPAPAAAAPEDDPDLDPNRNQPDFTIVNLPTTLRAQAPPQRGQDALPRPTAPNMIQMQPQQEAVVFRDAPRQCPPQGRDLRPQPLARQLRE